MNMDKKIKTLRNLQSDIMIEDDEIDVLEEIIKEMKMFDEIKKIIAKEKEYEENYFNHTSAMIDDINDILNN